MSNCTFKRIFAETEFAFDDLWRGLVVEGEDAGEFFDYAEDTLGIFINLDVGFLAVGDIHLAIFFHLGNPEVKDFAWAVFAVGFPGRNKGRIFVINGYKYAESNPEMETNAKVQNQWEYFNTRQHRRRRSFSKKI